MPLIRAAILRFRSTRYGAFTYRQGLVAIMYHMKYGMDWANLGRTVTKKARPLQECKC